MVGMLSQQQLLAEIDALYRERFPDFVAIAASIVGERETAREAVQGNARSSVAARSAYRFSAEAGTACRS